MFQQPTKATRSLARPQWCVPLAAKVGRTVPLASAPTHQLKGWPTQWWTTQTIQEIHVGSPTGAGRRYQLLQWWLTDQSWAIQLPQNPFTSVLVITESGDTGLNTMLRTYVSPGRETLVVLRKNLNLNIYHKLFHHGFLLTIPILIKTGLQ